MRIILFILPLLLLACSTSNSTTVTGETPKTEASAPAADPIASTIEELDAKYPELEKAYFAGGCFWCTEASFTRIQGVVDVYSGYTAGPEENPTYREVASGLTGHTEAIVVYYDPAKITYDKLLDVFFVAHDPTTLNRQGPDRGTQYRSGIYFLNESQAAAAKAKIAYLNEMGKFDGPIVTELEAAGKFWVAEKYHQNYYEDDSNPNWSYVTNVSKPKVEKVKKVFADIIKPEYKDK